MGDRIGVVLVIVEVTVDVELRDMLGFVVRTSVALVIVTPLPAPSSRKVTMGLDTTGVSRVLTGKDTLTSAWLTLAWASVRSVIPCTEFPADVT